MKIRSKISYGLFVWSICLVVLMLASYVFLAITQIWWPAAVLTIAVICLCLVYFNTFYELLPEGIMLSSGFFAKAISYKSILSMTDEDCSTPSFCLSNKRVMIKYVEDDKLKYTYASPANREQFRELVNREINRVAQENKQDESTFVQPSVQSQKPTRNASNEIALVGEQIQHDGEPATLKKPPKTDFDKKFNIMFDKSGAKLTKQAKKKEQEEKKLLVKLRKEKQKETKQAVKLEKENRVKEQNILRKQAIRNEKIREEKLKNQAKEQKQKLIDKKLDQKQAQFAAKETAKSNKMQAKLQAKEDKKTGQNKEKKQRKAAAKQVEKLKKSDQKATERKLKQEKKSPKQDDIA